MDRDNMPAQHGSFDLRYDMVRHALDSHRTAILTRRMAIVLVVALLILQCTAPAWPLPWAPWVVQHRTALALVSIFLTCFTAAHQWCAARRLEESEDALLAFVECRRW